MQKPDPSAPAAQKIEPRLRTKELKEKAGLLSSHYVYDIWFAAEDFAQFQPFFEKVTGELYEWGRQRGKKCGRVQIKAVIHPWIVGRVRQYFDNLRGSDSHAYLQRIPMQITLLAVDGKPIQRFVREPGEAPRDDSL